MGDSVGKWGGFFGLQLTARVIAIQHRLCPYSLYGGRENATLVLYWPSCSMRDCHLVDRVIRLIRGRSEISMGPLISFLSFTMKYLGSDVQVTGLGLTDAFLVNELAQPSRPSL